MTEYWEWASKHLEWEWNRTGVRKSLTLKLVPKISMRLSRMNPTSLESADSTFVRRSTSALSGVTEVIGPLLRLLSGLLSELVTDVTAHDDKFLHKNITLMRIVCVCVCDPSRSVSYIWQVEVQL